MTIDGGDTSHMAKMRSSFFEYSELNVPEYVVIADGSRMQVVGRGIVQLRVRVSANKS